MAIPGTSTPEVRGERVRYLYLGTRDTDPALKGQPCDPVRRPDGKCIVGRGNQLVRFADGSVRVVVRRRLRVGEKPKPSTMSSRKEMPR